jgi:hypothetical protein
MIVMIIMEMIMVVMKEVVAFPLMEGIDNGDGYCI